MKEKKVPMPISAVRGEVINLFKGRVPENGYSCTEIASLANFDSLGLVLQTRAVIIHYVLAGLKLQGLICEKDSRWYPVDFEIGLTDAQIAAAYVRKLLFGKDHYIKDGI